ncbi:Organelle RRM domain-containing protein 6 [Citrus sinensis]|uniref:Organelle RRM domain-containing protein 6 n=1 Tax=Citrus sinensis TaxID=2711 RepID=A0ACB8M520_CITSI|nr:Organelle RRM domain-containing protein 6 [Citrus sinensis]
MAVLGFLPVPTTYFNINQNLLIHNLTRHSPAPATPFTIKRRDFDSLFSLRQGRGRGACFPLACLPPSPHSLSTWLSFRTSEDSLRNAFQGFGQLVEVNLVMDKIANRPRGFAFLRYATEEESRRAIEGMHGKLRHEMKPLGQQIYGGSVRPDVNHKQSGMTVDVVSQALELTITTFLVSFMSCRILSEFLLQKDEN